MISYFNDRILTPEMMRAMIILYIGPHNRPDFSTDFLLSPLLAPEALLARMPKTYILTGERDPLVDDTVIFAGRLRQAKAAAHLERKELDLLPPKSEFVEQDHVEVVLVPGISHGFLQFVSVFPEGWRYIFRCARWMRDIFERADRDEAEVNRADYFASNRSANGSLRAVRHHRRMGTASSGDDERPLEMSVGSARSGESFSSRGSRRKREAEGNGRPITRRQKSLVSLASEDDLLGRRMKGLTGGLMGGVDELVIPPTP